MFPGFGHFQLCFQTDVILRKFPKKIEKIRVHLTSRRSHLTHLASHNMYLLLLDDLFLREKKAFFFYYKNFLCSSDLYWNRVHTTSRKQTSQERNLFFKQISERYVGNVCFPPFLPYVEKVISMLRCFWTTLDLAQNR